MKTKLKIIPIILMSLIVASCNTNNSSSTVSNISEGIGSSESISEFSETSLSEESSNSEPTSTSYSEESSSETVQTYKVNVTRNENYTIKFANNQTIYEINDFVSFTVESTNDEAILDSISIKDSNNVDIEYQNEEQNYSFNMPNSDVTISIINSYKTYNINVEENELVNFSFTNLTENNVKAGTFIGFTVAPINEEINLLEIKITTEDNNVFFTNNGGVYSFDMPNSDVTISFVTAYKEYAVILDNDTNVNVAFTNDKYSYRKGDTVTFTAAGKNGYSITDIFIKTISSKDVELTNGEFYTFVMPNENVIISFVVEETVYSINVNAGEHSYIKLKDTKYKEGETVNFTISFDEGWIIDEVSITYDENSVSFTVLDGTYSFKMPANDVTINLTAKEKPSENVDPFNTKMTFEGSWTYDYDYTMRLRVVFSGSGTFEWFLTYEYNYDEWEWYSVKPKFITKPSDMEGTLRDNSNAPIEYTYDSESDSISFNTNYKSVTKDMTIKIVRDGKDISYIYFTENMADEYWAVGNRYLYIKK